MNSITSFLFDIMSQQTNFVLISIYHSLFTINYYSFYILSFVILADPICVETTSQHTDAQLGIPSKNFFYKKTERVQVQSNSNTLTNTATNFYQYIFEANWRVSKYLSNKSSGGKYTHWNIVIPMYFSMKPKIMFT